MGQGDDDEGEGLRVPPRCRQLPGAEHLADHVGDAGPQLPPEYHEAGPHLPIAHGALPELHEQQLRDLFLQQGEEELILAGALLVFAVGAFTAALQVWTGLVGIDLAILLFVVLGNPSAGGAYPAPLLPPFWAGTGPWLPPGAATNAIRGIVYFGGAGAGIGALVLAGYALVGLVATMLAAGRKTELALAEA